MGAVFQGKDAPPRARYTMRLRRALPALCLLLGLAVLAGMTWLRVLDRVEAGAAGAVACPTSAADPNKVQLRVYNATAREGVARTVSIQLLDRGYAVLAVENDPLSGVRLVEGTAEVRYGPGGVRWAESVRKQVPGATLYRDAREGRVIDVVLGERFSRLSTAAELAKSGRQGIAAVPAAPTRTTGPGPAC
ncbi:MAG: hypothetical protein AVDCRST_MAG41-3038 [uncultured Corynebacteriales bacterium]|uniref:LytR/CpsA/Psr regulator C-terminal domain-containing protein n=1 Tax=uncultured Mycobacteriales bacterium TaxID=581187 RepID=A0A6J4JBS3_9ACTN|nr:MAG: hypothetical protein AVDCRST_MAG41-3038 [uncultured Corynebacteriales bacterium]